MSKTYKNVRSIQITGYLNGRGLVNGGASSGEAIAVLRKAGLATAEFFNEKTGAPLKNIKLAQRNIYFNEDANCYEYEVKVTRECLCRTIFEKYIPVDKPIYANNPEILYRILAHPAMIMKGYLFPDVKDGTLKRKASYGLSDAVDIGPRKRFIQLDLHARSGEKELSEGKGSEDPKDTSLYKVENVGMAEYKYQGYINLQELAFLPADRSYGRMSVNVDGGDNERIFLNALKENMVDFEPSLQYYSRIGCITDDYDFERGILLNKASVDRIVKNFLSDLLNLSINRVGGYLKNEKVFITINHEGGCDTEELTPELLKDVTFEYNCIYKKLDLKEVEKRIADDKEAQKQAIERKKAARDAKNAAKEKARAKRAAAAAGATEDTDEEE